MGCRFERSKPRSRIPGNRKDRLKARLHKRRHFLTVCRISERHVV